MSVAEVLVQSAIKVVGKREFLKAVETICPAKKKSEKTFENNIPQCEARVKGDRSDIKIGRHVLYESLRCARGEINTDSHLCKIHTNQVDKFGSLPFGRFTEELNDEQRKVFF